MGYLIRSVNTWGRLEGNATEYLSGRDRASSATSQSGGSTSRRGHDERLRELQLTLV
jgi:hypothetical protein